MAISLRKARSESLRGFTADFPPSTPSSSSDGQKSGSAKCPRETPGHGALRRLLQDGGMPKNKRKRAPKTVLRLPDLEQSKSAVLNSLASQSSQRSYDHAIREFIEWYVRPFVPRSRRRTGADSVLARTRQRSDDGALFGMQAAASECDQRFHRDRTRAIPPHLILADLRVLIGRRRVTTVRVVTIQSEGRNTQRRRRAEPLHERFLLHAKRWGPPCAAITRRFPMNRVSSFQLITSPAPVLRGKP